MDIDSNNNLILAGTFNTDATNYLSSTPYALSGSANSIFLDKFNSSGSFVTAYAWAAASGHNLTLSTMGVDQSNNIYLQGTFNGTVNFSPAGNTDNKTSTPTVNYLTKIGNDGTYNYTDVWDNSNFTVNKLRFDTDGKIYLLGSSTGNTNFSPSGNNTINSLGGIDSFMSILRTDGSYVHTFTWGGSSDDSLNDAVFDANSYLYLAGKTNSSTPYSGVSLKGTQDAYVTEWQPTANVAPSSPASLAQYQSDGTTTLTNSTWTGASGVVLKFNMSSTNMDDTLTPQVEIEPNGTAFTNTVTNSGSNIAYSGTAVTGTVAVAGLADGTYHWQARVNNSAGNSGWVQMGGNPDFKSDSNAPTGGSITYTNGYNTTGTISLTVSDGTDAYSGVNTSSRVIQRRSTTLENGLCAGYGSYSTITPSGSYPNFTDATVVSGNCYEYQYLVSDNTGNQATYTSSNVIYAETTGPSAPGTPSTTSPTNSSSQTWTWTAATDTISGIVSYAWRTTGSLISSGVSFTNSVITNLADGVYNFFVKALSVSGLYGSESSSTVTVDTTPPVTTDNADSSWHNSSVTITLSCSDATTSCAHTYYTTDGTTPTTSSSTGNSFTLSTDGTYTIKYFSVDSVNNQETVKTAVNQVKIDTTAPTFSSKTTYSGWHNSNQTSTFTYADSGGSGIASGTPVTCTISTEGSAQTCSVTPNVCDVAGNCNTTPVTSNGANIDKTTPAGGSIGYTDGYFTSTSVALTANDGTDTGSSINSATRILQRQSANLILGICGVYGSFFTITPSGSYPNLTDNTVVSGNCYKYQYLVSDNAGNQATYATGNAARVDTSTPSTPGTPSTTSPTNSTSQTWIWTAATDAVSDVVNYLWRTTGSGIFSGTYTTNSIVTNLAQGAYTLYITAVNGAGTHSNESQGGSVTVNTTLTISSVTPSAIDYTGVIIGWITNNNSSSKIDYGLTASYGNSTTEIDTSPRVTIHSVPILNLIECSTYHYRVRSIDASANEIIDGDRTFTTTCTGAALVTASTSSQVTNAGGGSLTLQDSNSHGLSLTIPSSSLATANVDFQAHQLNTTTALSTTSTPSNFALVGGYLYQLTALSDPLTSTTTFTKPLTVTMSYGASDVAGMDESTFKIYRWDDGTGWTALTGCVVDTSAKTVTCQTSNFSVFGLFGVPPVNNTNSNNSNSGNSSNNSSNNSNSTCGNQAPTSTPDLFQINTIGTKATLYFAPAGMPYDSYVIRFGPTANNLLYSASFSRGFAGGVIYYTINELSPNTVYYFQVRANNGCMPGNWGNIVMTKTTGNNKVTKISYKSLGGFVQSLVNTFSQKYTGNAIKTNGATNNINNPKNTTTPQKVINNVIPSVQKTNQVSIPKKKACFLFICW